MFYINILICIIEIYVVICVFTGFVAGAIEFGINLVYFDDSKNPLKFTKKLLRIVYTVKEATITFLKITWWMICCMPIALFKKIQDIFIIARNT